jgi:hypothetical protein
MSPEDRDAAKSQYMQNRQSWQGMNDSERNAARQQYRQKYQR